MTSDGFILDDPPESVFEERNFYFWVKCVIDAMDLLGPETDQDLKRMCQLLLDYHAGVDVAAEAIDGISREITRLGMHPSGKNTSPLGLKYRCLWAIASSRESNLADLYDWQYGVTTAFENINLHTLNCLFADGHVKSMKPMATLAPVNLWTRDSAPFVGQHFRNAKATLKHAEGE